MTDEPTNEPTPDVWAEFLQARVRAILWLHDTVLLKDSEIAKALNLDATQVFVLRTGAVSSDAVAGDDDKTQAAPLPEG